MGLEPLEPGAERLHRCTARLNRDRGLLRGGAHLVGGAARGHKRAANRLALELEFRPALFVSLHRLECRFQLLARGAGIGLRRVDFAGKLARLGGQAREPIGGLLGARLQRLKLAAQIDVTAVQPVGQLLGLVARLVELLDAAAGGSKSRIAFTQATLGGRQLFAQRTNFLLALDDAGMRILVAADAQPVAANPDTIASDHRLARRQRGAARERLVEPLDRVDAAQQRLKCPRTRDLRDQLGRRTGARGAARVLTHKGDLTDGQVPDQGSNGVEAIDANGFEVTAEHGLDRARPGRFDTQLLCQPRARGQRVSRQPVDHLAFDCAERRLLQRLERD